jgi:hypothetical protein
VTYLAAALFFTLALLAALVTIHVTVRLSWREILLAVRGELGAATPPAAAPAPALRPHAAL